MDDISRAISEMTAARDVVANLQRMNNLSHHDLLSVTVSFTLSDGESYSLDLPLQDDSQCLQSCLQLLQQDLLQRIVPAVQAEHAAILRVVELLSLEASRLATVVAAKTS